MIQVTCKLCGYIDAQCDDSMLLTSEPPQYKCYCNKCTQTFYIYCSELSKYKQDKTEVNLATSLDIAALDERIKFLEAQMVAVREILLKMQDQILVAALM